MYTGQIQCCFDVSAINKIIENALKAWRSHVRQVGCSADEVIGFQQARVRGCCGVENASEG